RCAHDGSLPDPFVPGAAASGGERTEMDLLQWLFDARIDFAGGQFLLLREVLGNVFGLLSALGGMRRRVWAWPIGIAGNLLLLTVFLGTVFGSPNSVDLLGQAGRQVMFIATAVYGWVRWNQARHEGGTAVEPRWASWGTRALLVVVLVGGTAALTPLFRMLGSYAPVWADAWIFMGSLLSTFGMGKGGVECWLIWVAVDLVGVPLLLSAGYCASAFMYVLYGAFTLTGCFVWWRVRSRQDAEEARVTVETAQLAPTVRQD